jgi:hypothetical protein
LQEVSETTKQYISIDMVSNLISPKYSFVLFFILFYISVQVIENPKFQPFQAERSKPTRESCTFFTGDLHDGVRSDLAAALPALGHNLILGGIKQGRLPHKGLLENQRVSVMKRPPSSQEISHWSNSLYWSESDIWGHFEYYKNDDQISKVDAFICGFPAAMCEAFMPFNKSIVIIAAHRYSLGMCTRPRWKRLNEHFLELISAAYKGHLIAALTQYDAEYINYYTGLKVPVILFSALWYAEKERVIADDSKRRDEILLGPLQRTQVNAEITEGFRLAGGSKWKFSFVKPLYGRYELKNIAAHRAMVIFPYATTSFGIIEVYALGVPLFVPDVDFLFQLGTMDDLQLSSNYYCGVNIMMDKHPQSSHSFSPEDPFTLESFRFWIKFADFYTWPHITRFSSWSDLNYKLSNANFSSISDDMRRENARRKDELKFQWNSICDNIPAGSVIPQEYDMNLKSMQSD